MKKQLKEDVEFNNLTLCVRDDLAVRIASECKVTLQGFPELKRILKSIRSAPEQLIEPVVFDPILATIGA